MRIALNIGILMGAAAAQLTIPPNLALAQSCPPQISDPQPLNSNAAFDTAHEARPQIGTDGAGNWIAVWMVAEPLDAPFGFATDIFFARSTDGGSSWSEAAPLDPNATSDDADDYTPRIAVDGRGNWVAAWQSTDDRGGTIGNDWDYLFTRSTDDGASWSDPQPLNTNAASDSGADFALQLFLDRGGDWLAVWLSTEDLGATIGEDWDILFARSTDGGASWSDPEVLNTNAGSDTSDDQNPRLLSDGHGNWLASWVSRDSLGGRIGEDSDILVARSSDGWASWSEPMPLNSNAATDNGADWAQQLTTNGAGNWVAVWISNDDLGGTIGTDHDILYSRSTDNGVSWSDPQPLNSNAATDGAADLWPRVRSDEAGNWVAVWASLDDLHGTIGDDWDILFSHSTDNGLSWTAAQPLNTNAYWDTGDDPVVRLEIDAAGNWLAGWSSDDDLDGTIGNDRDILYSTSTDGGASWTDPAPLNTNAAKDSGSDGLVWLESDRAGSWFVGWGSRDDLGGTIGEDSDLLFARLVFPVDGRETICHVPPGNRRRARTIVVDENAVPAHLGHGDHCGPCE